MSDAARVKAAYKRSLTRVGQTISVRRYSGTGPARAKVDTPAKARVTGYDPEELIGTIVQGDRKVIVLVEDLIENGFTLPVTTNDKLVVDGKELAIQAVDGNTRKVAGVLIAYEIQARG